MEHHQEGEDAHLSQGYVLRSLRELILDGTTCPTLEQKAANSFCMSVCSRRMRRCASGMVWGIHISAVHHEPPYRINLDHKEETVFRLGLIWHWPCCERQVCSSDGPFVSTLWLTRDQGNCTAEGPPHPAIACLRSLVRASVKGRTGGRPLGSPRSGFPGQGQDKFGVSWSRTSSPAPLPPPSAGPCGL